MTGNDDAPDSDARRSFMKKGVLGAGALALGSSAATAQQDGAGDGDGLGDGQEWDKAIVPASQFHPASRFVISSPVLRWQPRVDAIQDNVWSEYNTRVIRYLNTNEMSLFWQAQDAEVPNFNEQAGYVVDAEGDTGPDGTPQPEVFRMHSESSMFGDSGFVTVNFTPVGEDEEDQWLDNEDWWLEDGDDDAVGIDDIDGVGGGNETGGAGVGNETGNDTGGGGVFGNDTDNDTGL